MLQYVELKKSTDLGFRTPAAIQQEGIWALFEGALVENISIRGAYTKSKMSA